MACGCGRLQPRRDRQNRRNQPNRRERGTQSSILKKLGSPRRRQSLRQNPISQIFLLFFQFVFRLISSGAPLRDGKDPTTRIGLIVERSFIVSLDEKIVLLATDVKQRYGGFT